MLRRCLVVLVVVLTGVPAFGTPVGAIGGGSPVPDGSWAFVANVNVDGGRACTGALVSPQWVLTATTCFSAGGQAVTTGAPARPTTVTVGRTDLAGSGGRAVPVVRIVPHPDRGVLLAKLALRVTDIAPVAVSGTGPAAGEGVQVAGYGRTATEWVPDRLQAAPAVVGAVAATTFGWTGRDASQAAACKGDTGGPVFRTGGAQPELVGLHLASWQGGCLGETDTRHGATAARVDDLRAWITRNATEPTSAFRNYFNTAAGIGGYNLLSTADQVVPFDYDHSGRLDHLLLYRPGSGTAWILKQGATNAFSAVFHSSTGIGRYDLRSAADRIVPFDYDHSGKLDHLLLYRPGGRIVYILKHGAGNTFTTVYANSVNGIGGYDVADARDRIIAYDYDHSGKQDHLLLYRPGTGSVQILKHGTGNTFTPVFKSGTGFPGYSLAHPRDQVLAFDYEHSGKLDHLVLYRPGTSTVFILRHGTGTTFSAVYSSSTAGIGGYNLADTRDQIVAYDYEHSGRLDHLLLYRPGAGTAWILRHGTGNAFSAVYVNSTTGIGGYDLKVASDRVVPFDYEHSGGRGHLLLYRPGNGIAWVVGRVQIAPADPPVAAQPGADGPDSIVETFGYPGAAAILESLNVRLISGDGHVVLADCTTPPVDNVGVIKVWTTEPVGENAGGVVCFRVTASTGRLDLEVPGVYEIRGDGQQAGSGHQLTAVVTTATGPPTSVVVNPSGSTQVGIGADPNNQPTTLRQLRVPS